MSGRNWITYHVAVLRAVPHVHLGAFVNLGVVVHARSVEFLGMRAITDPGALRDRLPETPPRCRTARSSAARWRAAACPR
jgi:hypothetical protein